MSSQFDLSNAGSVPMRQRGSPIGTGHGKSIAQYGEIFQGQIEDEHAQLHRCLVSMPCPRLASRAALYPEIGTELRVSPAHKQKAKKVVELTLSYFHAQHIGGLLTIESDIPEAKGCGSSTADCIAAVIATADALQESPTEEEIARLVVQAEIASDNIMFHRAVLFAHREGIVLEDFAKALPKLEILGIDTARDEIVETLKFPPATYSWKQLQQFRVMASALKRAIRTSDLMLLARVATASACVNQAFLPKPCFEEIRRVAAEAGALGVGAAHSGTVLTILLNPDDPLLDLRIEQIKTRLNRFGIEEVFRFRN